MSLRRLLVDPVQHRLGDDLLQLFVRIALAAPFFLSGRTKIAEGTWFTISDATLSLFETEYAGVPLPYQLSAVAATIAEHLLPALLLLGLGSRLAALGLAIMTMTIQIFVYPDAWWSVHMTWVALALVVMARGPGRISLDALVFERPRE